MPKKRGELTPAQIERMRAQNRDWHKRNAERSRARHRLWVANNKDRVQAQYREYHVKRLYGLTPAQLHGLGWTCFICQAVAAPDKRRLHVDHDHATGDVRGLLCSSCNTALGSLKDSQTLLRRALAYLVRFQGDEAMEQAS